MTMTKPKTKVKKCKHCGGDCCPVRDRIGIVYRCEWCTRQQWKVPVCRLVFRFPRHSGEDDPGFEDIIRTLEDH